MYAVAVCDDQEELQSDIVCQCGSILRELGVEHEIRAFPSAETLEAELRSGARFDLLCLDILMDGESGLELARKIRMTDDRVSILFLTGSQDFLRDGYEVRPIQYLLKPVDRASLGKAIETDLRINHRARTVSFCVGKRTVVFPLEDICYIESRDHGSLLHMTGEDTFLPLSLSETEALLPKERFCRCHKSFLVNLSCIRELNGRTLRLANTELSLGRQYASVFRERFIRYLNEK